MPGTGRRSLPILLVLSLVVLAWHNRFIQDDAFIVFRYAENLAKGNGLVWNVGERVEGYTTFLWTLLLTSAPLCGLDPVDVAYVFGLVLFAVTLAFTYRLARNLLGSVSAALLAVGLLGTNYTFSRYATGGLETQLQACLFVVAAVLLTQLNSGGPVVLSRLLGFSLVMAAALLTRLDSGLLALMLVSPGLWILRSQRGTARVKALAALLLPVTAIIGAWLVWKLSYYGGILPNTYYVKGPANASWFAGLEYLYLFLLSYWLFPLAIIGGCAFLTRKARPHPTTSALILLVTLWGAYVVAIGGDFMEFRFFVPVLPFIMVGIAWLIGDYVRQRALGVALALLVLAGSIHHALLFERFTTRRSILTIERLHEHLFRPQDNWTAIGTILWDAFRGDPSVSIAVFPAGAIPYYSRLPAVDMFGLSDPWIAQHGDVSSQFWAGHSRSAPASYLLARRVNLVIGNPWLRNDVQPDDCTYSLDELLPLGLGRLSAEELPASAELLEVPVEHGYRLVMLYLTESEAVERVAARSGWKRCVLRRD